ncbi:MAG: hypothetical protein CFE25_11940 [Chitinophagaceae bacterium BSSC1]|nr:MAG: hypothetical protein CFE25_11940 [Chitinophagaceae bacterium BSSC1]
MKSLFFILFITTVAPKAMLAQIKPKTIFLQKKQIKDSVYLPNRLFTDWETNTMPVVNENELKESEEQMPPMLQAAKDPYTAITGFQFSALRITARGLGNASNLVMVNGIPMLDLANGTGLWSSWNGLNPIFRVGESNTVIQQSDAGISLLGTSSNMDIRPYKQRAGIDIGYGFGNRGATHRLYLGMHSGLSPKGWSWGLAIAARASLVPMIPGVQNNGRSFFLGVDKKMGSGNVISLAFFGALMQTDRQAAILKESIDILGDHAYNPAWGYQNGQQRNANQTKQFLPTLLLTQEHKFSNQSFLQTSIAVSAGYRNGTGLDWYHAPDPRPDYYRYLPSYQTDPVLKEATTQALQNNIDLRQLNWHRFYQINENSFDQIINANGIIGNTVSGKRASYILENRHQDIQRYLMAITYHGLLKEKVFFSTGISIQWQRSHFYKTVADLLGASFYVNWNQFAESEIPNDPAAIQFDLQQPNRILKLHDQFGYDYIMTNHKTNLWFQTAQQIGKWGWAISLELGSSGFWREGLVANGLFPDESLGPSHKQFFINNGGRFTLNRILNGKTRLYLATAIQTSPPNADNVFISPRTRNHQQNIVSNQQTISAEMGYLIQSSNLKSRFSLYWMQVRNAMDVISFYHDAYNSFVNYAISGIGQRHLGLEWAMDAKLLGQWHFQTGIHLGNFVYNTRQFASITVDNTAAELNQVFIYAKQHPIGGAPQQAISIGFNNRTNGNWFWSINANFFDRQWMVWNPIRRTAEALYPVDPNSEKGQRLLLPERLPPQTNLNLYLSKRFISKRNSAGHLDLSMSINNLLNKQDLLISAAEQLRFDFDNRDPEKFAPKYFFGQGLSMNCSINYHF